MENNRFLKIKGKFCPFFSQFSFCLRQTLPLLPLRIPNMIPYLNIVHYFHNKIFQKKLKKDLLLFVKKEKIMIQTKRIFFGVIQHHL